MIVFFCFTKNYNWKVEKGEKKITASPPQKKDRQKKSRLLYKRDKSHTIVEVQELARKGAVTSLIGM